MFCHICNKDIESTNVAFVNVHLKKEHNISSIDYYKTYIDTDAGICSCGKATKYLNIKNGFAKYCSSGCSNSSLETIQKKKQTCLRSYGVDSPLKSDIVKSKLKATNLERYGFEYGLSNQEVKDKIAQTNITLYGVSNQLRRTEYIKNAVISKHGVDNVSKIPCVREKATNTMKLLYGVEHALQNSTIREKSESTCLIHYGVNSPLKSDEIKQKVKNTVNSKYGVDSVLQSPEVKTKITATIIDRYGVDHPSKSTIIQMKRSKTSRADYWNTYIAKMNLKKLLPLFDMNTYVNATGCMQIQCISCNSIFDTEETNPQRITCGCMKIRSIHEDELISYIKNDLNITDIVTNKIFYYNGIKYELDIYIPSINFGIELDGIYWHSELHKESNYHINKTNFFSSLGIKIIHIFDCEWINKKEQVKAIIQTKLNKNTQLYARKCVIKELKSSETIDFLNDNHIQGHIQSKINIGLFHNDSLISVMTFSTPRYNSNYDYELIRYCVMSGVNCVGGFSKMLKYFELTYKPIKLISYCDKRYFDGSGYISNGFAKLYDSEPAYYYFKQNTYTLFNRVKFQKHKLAKLLPIFDETKTEHENMLINKYLRIYDCGNTVLEKNSN